MKVAIVGANGSIGRVFLHHTLKRNDVHSIIAVTRKPEPSITSLDARVRNVVIPDFSNLNAVSHTTWSAIEDSDTLIWAIGTYNVDKDVNYAYPLAFQHTLTHRRIAIHTQGSKLSKLGKLRFIVLGGAFTQTDQSRSLYFLPVQRRTKGLLQTETLAFASQHGDYIVAHVIKPGGILIGWSPVINWLAQSVFGANLIVRDEELGTFVADLAVNGSGRNVIENWEIVTSGRARLTST